MHVHTSPCHRLPRPGLILAAALSLALVPREPLAGANDFAPRAAFSIQQQDQTSWLVSPDGERFFSLGVCCVNQGLPPGEFDPANPDYAAWRRYADSNHWARATVERLDGWGFTTVGGWSDFQSVRQRPEHDLAFAPVLHIGATAGAPWWDMWDSRVVTRMDEVAREQILPLRDDPRVIGHLGLYAQDVVEDVLYRGKTVPAGDRAEWTVSLAERGQPIRARLGAGREPVADEPSVRIVNLSGVNGDLRNIAGMELPARLFGRNRFRRGDTVEFSATLLTHGRAHCVEWKGRFTLRRPALPPERRGPS